MCINILLNVVIKVSLLSVVLTSVVRLNVVAPSLLNLNCVDHLTNFDVLVITCSFFKIRRKPIKIYFAQFTILSIKLERLSIT